MELQINNWLFSHQITCKKIIIFSTAELWNGYDGPVSINLPFNYGYSPYIKSKQILSEYISENKKNY